MDEFIESIEPGLLTYKDELFMRSVTSMATLKYLRPREINEMKIPSVYKRLLIDKVISLQSPETRSAMKKDTSPFCSQVIRTGESKTNRKRLFTPTNLNDDLGGAKGLGNISNEPPEKEKAGTTKLNDTSASVVPEKNLGYVEQEIQQLTETQKALSIELNQKREELNLKKMSPVPPKPIAIPGCMPLKVVCDNCHHPGHRSSGNRGNKACPYLKCEGFHYCGLVSKHKEYRAEITEMEKEISCLERTLKDQSSQLQSLKIFMKTNATSFVTVVKGQLKGLFPKKYCNRDGNQRLQKDIRLLKIATGGKVPEKLYVSDVEKLLNDGRNKITLTCGNIDDTVDISLAKDTNSLPPCTTTTAILDHPASVTNPRSPAPVWYPWNSIASPSVYTWNPHYSHWPVNPSVPTTNAAWNASASYMYGSPSCTITRPDQEIFPPLPLHEDGDASVQNPPLPSDDDLIK